MARTLEDVLKARGYADSDLEALKPMLSDQKFRSAMEEEFGVLESDKQKLSDDVNRWSEWHQKEAIPKIDKALKAEQDARSRAAAAEARLKAIQEQGLIELAADDPANNPPEPKSKDNEVAFDPKKHNLVTMDDVARFAEAEGDAIAIAQDIAAEHTALFGKPLTNFRELRKKAIEAKQPVYQYWESTYKVADKRNEIAAKEKQAYEDQIRKDERAKMIAEQANPMTRPGMPSRAPFMPAAKDKEGATPWDNPQARTNERIRKATEKVLQSQVQ